MSEILALVLEIVEQRRRNGLGVGAVRVGAVVVCRHTLRVLLVRVRAEPEELSEGQRPAEAAAIGAGYRGEAARFAGLG